ncbi:unnamed protein product [Dibothriocephalus latus]|uniref:Uncharacterized protein n=1 Tax=Dibothriocephalus latus TaxID=60516 RepID=A0A3P7NQH3_DIBLA|nr:unnamed protein product [Dibothriocephalus latus]
MVGIVSHAEKTPADTPEWHLSVFVNKKWTTSFFNQTMDAIYPKFFHNQCDKTIFDVYPVTYMHTMDHLREERCIHEDLLGGRFFTICFVYSQVYPLAFFEEYFCIWAL